MQDDTQPPTTLRINAVTRTDRLACTAAVRDIIVATCHGWIGEFYQYSNTSLCLHFELPRANLELLRDSLVTAGLSFSNDSLQVLRVALAEQRGSPAIACTLQISFVHSEPDLRRYVPSIPG